MRSSESIVLRAREYMHEQRDGGHNYGRALPPFNDAVIKERAHGHRFNRARTLLPFLHIQLCELSSILTTLEGTENKLVAVHEHVNGPQLYPRVVSSGRSLYARRRQ